MGKKGYGKGSVEALLGLLPRQALEEIANQTGANRHVKRLEATLFFKLLLYGVLKSGRLSSRLLAYYYNSSFFKQLTGKGKHQTRHSSLSDRLKNLSPVFLREIFEHMKQRVEAAYPTPVRGQAYVLKQVDSTLIPVSASLLKEGMQVGKKSQSSAGKKQIKASLTLKEGLPFALRIFQERTYLSEDKALVEAMQSQPHAPHEVFVFDRGVSSRAFFDELQQQGKGFVGRLKADVRYRIEQQKACQGNILQDAVVYLRTGKEQWTQHPFRLLQVETPSEVLFLLTNLHELEAAQLAQLYKRRWEIEVFFKFLKQELRIEQLISYHKQAIENMLYVQLIASMLLLLYKRENKIESYRLARVQFEEELLETLCKQLTHPPLRKAKNHPSQLLI